MKHHMYLTVRVETQTDLPLIEAVRELETLTQITVSSTPNVAVLETELLKSELPTFKTKDDGTQS
jgi:hypothetical protein